jgi:hypothetical protein
MQCSDPERQIYGLGATRACQAEEQPVGGEGWRWGWTPGRLVSFERGRHGERAALRVILVALWDTAAQPASRRLKY